MDQVEIFRRFQAHFEPLLGETQRWPGFHFLARHLIFNCDGPNIVETGCVHYPNDWKGQGASTQVWDWMVAHNQASATSFDLSPEHCRAAELVCPNSEIICRDSIEGLKAMKHRMDSVDLLFLDSMDTDPPYAQAYLHAAGELASCYHDLRKGCMIAIDDCNLLSPKGGKDYFITQFFADMGIIPVLRSYITVWQKP